jgi:uncharacterized 2Fe-2S/4Fe-4S cluster protein (DUF4445 family)
MPQLTVIDGDAGSTRAIPFTPGVAVREILEGAGLKVRVGCSGNGVCGLCLVRTEGDAAGAATKNELLVLRPEQLLQKIRLACQLLPMGDLEIQIINKASKPKWRDLDPDSVPFAPILPELSKGMQAVDVGYGVGYGLAVDLGTTQVSLSLWDLVTGRRVDRRIGPNPQSSFGADVVARLIAAGESGGNAQQLAQLPLEAMAEAVEQMCRREGCRPQQVVQAAFVGNTAMLLLLTGADAQRLLQPRNWTRPAEFSTDPGDGWASLLGIHPQAALEVIPPLAGFVGSDLLAGVLATCLTSHPGSLLIDFGTNSEMALWDGQTLWVTSVAGGPAFESCGLQCGMPAEPGAIYRFQKPHGSAEPEFEVMGGGEAKGFCGSGLVDLIASLCNSGELTSTGGFPSQGRQGRKDGYVVPRTDPVIRLTKKDVDAFQRAKAAVGAGIGALLARAEIGAAELSRVCVCGVFGLNLNISNAQCIGLLPDVSPGRVEVCGNTALAGCEHLLLSPGRSSEIASLIERSKMINLSQTSEFDALFLENLYLRPLEV